MGIVPNPKDSDYSPTWRWIDDEELVAAHVEFRRAQTEYGDSVVWEVNADGTGPASVWLQPANLVAKVRAELARRKTATGEARLEPGERVRINPGRKRPSKRNPKQTVWPFPTVAFEHGVPETSAEEFLLARAVETDNGKEALEEAVEANSPLPKPQQEEEAGDDIPF
jgi:hypothetical protein